MLAKGTHKKVAPKVKNGRFTTGINKCDDCGRKPLMAYGNRPGFSLTGTYHLNGKELCRECAKKKRVI